MVKSSIEIIIQNINSLRFVKFYILKISIYIYLKFFYYILFFNMLHASMINLTVHSIRKKNFF